MAWWHVWGLSLHLCWLCRLMHSTPTTPTGWKHVPPSTLALSHIWHLPDDSSSTSPQYTNSSSLSCLTITHSVFIVSHGWPGYFLQLPMQDELACFCFLFLFSNFYVYECFAHMYAYVSHLCLVSVDARRRHEIPWIYSCELPCGY